jgi:diguanylate cyclase (GGDEF)-like protein/PAS domain S-box-containing protein
MLSQQELAEQERVKALHKLGILDTPFEDRFDRFTRIAAVAFGVPIALVSLVDSERQWFKSRMGLEVCETSRSLAFCSHAIALDEMLVVEDTHLDERFAGHGLVLDAPFIRFYAGQPVYSLDGQALGTLCVIDTRPRQFGEGERRMLRDLAQMVQDELNRDVVVAARDAAQMALRELNVQLEQRVQQRTAELHAKNQALQDEAAQRMAAERERRHNEARTRTIIETSLSAFVGMDDQGRIDEWNPAAETLFGWQRAEALGRPVTELIVPEAYRAAHDAGFARFLATGQGAVLNRRLELPVITRSGAESMVEMTINAFRIEGKLFVGAFMHDISARIAAEQALRQKQELLDAVLESVDVGVIACDAGGRLTLFNRTAREFHGLDVADVGLEDWAAYYGLYHADGVTPLGADEIPLARALRGEPQHDARMTIVAEGEAPRRLLVGGRALTDAQGGSLGAVVALKDVTELAESRARAVESEEWLRTIADNVPALIAYIDTRQRYRFANDRYREWFGVPREKMIGKTVLEAMGEAFYAPRRAALERCLQGHGSAIEIEEERRGRKRVISSTYLPHLRDGVVQGVYVLSTDSTSAREYERQLHALAHADHLTGLPNRRSYEERLAQAIGRSRRSGMALALVYLDVDHFKQINDTLGHAVGDVVLTAVARRLSGAVRSTDTVARLAGDEFVIVLEQVGSPLECERIAAKLLEAIRPELEVEGRKLSVTTSIGIAWCPRPEQAALTHAADEALYQSKRAGRDTATVQAVRAS